MSHPFFASLMLKRKFILDANIKTACTDGIVFKFSPSFIDTLSHEELVGTIAHEIMHISLLHHLRREWRNADKWNHAADYAINPMLMQSNFALPKGTLYNAAFVDKSAEEIYSLLPDGNEKDDDGEGQAGNDGQQKKEGLYSKPGMGDVEDYPATSKAELSKAEAEAKQEFAQAMQIAKQAGKMPQGLQRLVEEILQPKIHWQEVLSRFISEIAKNDYSFSKPNTRYLQSDFIMPSLYSIEMGEIVLMVDTSGSIDNELLNRFAGEMQDICGLFKSPIKVLYIDTEVAGEQDIEPDEPLELEPKGGGGTDFKPGFEWLQEHGISPKAVVYLTDGCCYSYPEEPEFPVLWAVTDNKHFEPPFGEVVNID